MAARGHKLRSPMFMCVSRRELSASCHTAVRAVFSLIHLAVHTCACDWRLRACVCHVYMFFIRLSGHPPGGSSACPICLSEIEAGEVFTVDCQDQHVFCVSCLHRHCSVQVRSAFRRRLFDHLTARAFVVRNVSSCCASAGSIQ